MAGGGGDEIVRGAKLAHQGSVDALESWTASNKSKPGPGIPRSLHCRQKKQEIACISESQVVMGHVSQGLPARLGCRAFGCLQETNDTLVVMVL